MLSYVYDFSPQMLTKCIATGHEDQVAAGYVSVNVSVEARHALVSSKDTPDSNLCNYERLIRCALPNIIEVSDLLVAHSQDLRMAVAPYKARTATSLFAVGSRDKSFDFPIVRCLREIEHS